MYTRNQKMLRMNKVANINIGNIPCKLFTMKRKFSCGILILNVVYLFNIYSVQWKAYIDTILQNKCPVYFFCVSVN